MKASTRRLAKELGTLDIALLDHQRKLQDLTVRRIALASQHRERQARTDFRRASFDPTYHTR